MADPPPEALVDCCDFVHLLLAQLFVAIMTTTFAAAAGGLCGLTAAGGVL